MEFYNLKGHDYHTSALKLGVNMLFLDFSSANSYSMTSITALQAQALYSCNAALI